MGCGDCQGVCEIFAKKFIRLTCVGAFAVL